MARIHGRSFLDHTEILLLLCLGLTGSHWKSCSSILGSNWMKSERNSYFYSILKASSEGQQAVSHWAQDIQQSYYGFHIKWVIKSVSHWCLIQTMWFSMKSSRSAFWWSQAVEQSAGILDLMLLKSSFSSHLGNMLTVPPGRVLQLIFQDHYLGPCLKTCDFCLEAPPVSRVSFCSTRGLNSRMWQVFQRWSH